MPEPGDLILVYFLDEQPRGKQFLKKRNEWPMHLTLVPWFTVGDEETTKEVLELCAEYNPQLQLIVGKDEQFGSDTTVSVIADQHDITLLHGALLATLQAAGTTLRDAQWTGDAYTAHVTHHDGQSTPKVGDTLAVTCFSLVKLLPNNVCEVVQPFKLGAAK